MTRVLARSLVPLSLLTWGVVFTWACFSGHVARYLHPSFRPGALAAGVVFLLLAVVWPFLAGAHECSEEHHDHDHGHDDDLSAGRVGRVLLLLVPLLVCVAINPTEYSPVAIRNREQPGGGRRAEQLSPALQIQGEAIFEETPAAGMPAPPKDEVLDATVSDLNFLSDDERLRSDFTGRRVKVAGQFNSQAAGAGRYRITRMVMWCCAADATPAVVTIEGDPGPSPVDAGWMAVTGRLRFEPHLGRHIPVVKQEQTEKIDPPQEGFLFN
jgi:putative membrane protein